MIPLKTNNINLHASFQNATSTCVTITDHASYGVSNVNLDIIVNGTVTGNGITIDSTGLGVSDVSINAKIHNAYASGIYINPKADRVTISGTLKNNNQAGASWYAVQNYGTNITLRDLYIIDTTVQNRGVYNNGSIILWDGGLVEGSTSKYVGGSGAIAAGYDFGVLSAEPTAFNAGDEYYNTTDDIKYSYDGSNWNSLTNEYYYGEAYIYNNAVATVIETADTPIALRQITTGLVNGWTFDSGSTGAITAYVNGGGGKVTVSDAAHGLSNGDIITIRGTTNYNGVFTVSDVTTDAFNITDTWVNDNGASDWDEGSHLIAGASSTGKYGLVYNCSCTEGGGAGSNVLGRLCNNSTLCIKCPSYRKFATNDYGSLPGTSILNITAGDKIYLTLTSSGTNAITCKYGNINLHRD